jgi:hypothetical protein
MRRRHRLHRALAALGACWLAGCGSSEPTEGAGGPAAPSPDAAGTDAGAGGAADASSDPRPGADGAADASAEPAALDAPDAAGEAADGATETGPVPGGPTRYPFGPLHSPMSAPVVARVDAVLSTTKGRKDVFAKVGDSITVSSSFLGCYAGSDVKYGGHGSLEPTRAFFAETKADSTHTSFDRPTLAAAVGWSAKAALTGSPNPIEKEVDAIQPAFAVIMFGTNETYPTGVHPFEHNLLADVDALLGLGVVPLMSTIPPRGDDPVANALVPEMNAVVRAVAQARQVPLMDYHQLLAGLPDYGLAGDGVHPQVYVSGGAHACWLTPDALQEGMNQRNLVVLEALDRAKRFALDHLAPEPAPPSLTGAGTPAKPFVIEALPFVDDRDTSKSASSALDVYACSPADEGGPEIVYELTLAAPAKIRARVFVDDGVDVDLHWLDGTDAASCVARADKTLEVSAGAGTFRLVADTYVSAGKPQPGAYRLTVVKAP